MSQKTNLLDGLADATNGNGEWATLHGEGVLVIQGDFAGATFDVEVTHDLTESGAVATLGQSSALMPATFPKVLELRAKGHWYRGVVTDATGSTAIRAFWRT